MIKRFIATALLGSALTTMALPAEDFDLNSYMKKFMGFEGMGLNGPEQIFVPIAKATVGGLSSKTAAEKRHIVKEVCELLADKTELNSKISKAVVYGGNEGGAYGESIAIFPFLNNKTEATCNTELWHQNNDYLLVKNQYMAGLPNTVSVETHGDTINVNMRTTKSVTKVLMFDENLIIKSIAGRTASNIDDDVKSYVGLVLDGIEAMQFTDQNLPDYTAATITDARIREALDGSGAGSMIEYGTPTISFDAGNLSAKDVVDAIIKQLRACNVADLDGDGKRCNGDPDVVLADTKVLPGLFMSYLRGDNGAEEAINEAMRNAHSVWEAGYTFQNWKLAKLYQPYSNKDFYQVSVCQPFYASAMLNITGSYHQTTMPCRASIWKKNNKIYISVSNPEMYLKAFFFDAEIPENVQRLFPPFAALVYNDIITMINNAFGSHAAFTIHPVQ